MKSLRFEKLQVLSRKEKKARALTFHRNLTILRGINYAGKSHLIKSLFFVFDAQPPEMSKEWTDSDFIYKCDFKLDDKKYVILRVKGIIGVFDAEGNKQIVTSHIHRDLAPFFADLFSFPIRLTDKNNDERFLPPSFLFIPFYIDQDQGWYQLWSSFRQLEQFQNWRQNIIEFHAGIKPKEYYLAKNREKDLFERIKDRIKERDILRGSLSHFVKRKQNFEALPKFDEYKNEINLLIKRLNQIAEEREKYRLKKVEAERTRYDLVQEKLLAEAAIRELEQDYKESLQSGDGRGIECPTCGEVHENSFVQRFRFNRDIHQMQQFVISMSEEIRDVESRIREMDDLEQKNKEHWKEINSFLNARKRDVALNDVLEAYGQQHAYQVLEEQIESLDKVIFDLDGKKEEAQREAKRFTPRERRREIQQYFYSMFNSFALKLDVPTAEALGIKGVTSTIKGSGNVRPRSILAFYMSFLFTIAEYGSSTFSPLVVDSPFQQEPDRQNRERIWQFLMNVYPKGAQRIVATVDDWAGNPDSYEYTFKEQHSALRDDDFDAVQAEIQPYLAKLQE